MINRLAKAYAYYYRVLHPLFMLVFAAYLAVLLYHSHGPLHAAMVIIVYAGSFWNGYRFAFEHPKPPVRGGKGTSK